MVSRLTTLSLDALRDNKNSFDKLVLKTELGLKEQGSRKRSIQQVAFGFRGAGQRT